MELGDKAIGVSYCMTFVDLILLLSSIRALVSRLAEWCYHNNLIAANRARAYNWGGIIARIVSAAISSECRQETTI